MGHDVLSRCAVCHWQSDVVAIGMAQEHTRADTPVSASYLAMFQYSSGV